MRVYLSICSLPPVGTHVVEEELQNTISYPGTPVTRVTPHHLTPPTLLFPSLPLLPTLLLHHRHHLFNVLVLVLKRPWVQKRPQIKTVVVGRVLFRVVARCQRGHFMPVFVMLGMKVRDFSRDFLRCQMGPLVNQGPRHCKGPLLQNFTVVPVPEKIEHTGSNDGKVVGMLVKQ